MTVQFSFSNGTSLLTLTPATQREKDLIRMFRDGTPEVGLSAPGRESPESLTIQAQAVAGKKEA